MWIYSLRYRQWVRTMEPAENAMDTGEPVPRFAHQMVYDPRREMFFMFGGNDGADDDQRLDDFWTLKLDRSVCCTSSLQLSEVGLTHLNLQVTNRRSRTKIKAANQTPKVGNTLVLS